MQTKIEADIDWDAIFSILEGWRDTLLAASAVTEGSVPQKQGSVPTSSLPSVTALALEHKSDPWAVLVSTILSLRTKDVVTLASSKRLLSRAPSPQELVLLEEEEIASLAYPAGFYKTKAKTLKRIAQILLDSYEGSVPQKLDQLLALPGVGLKTANLVLSEAFDLDAICVDIHVHRISQRMGWIATRTPDESEAELRKIVPRKYWKRINALLVQFGQNICTPLSPHCSICPVYKLCERRAVGRSR
ncbi:endonuclease III [Treponema sp.]